MPKSAEQLREDFLAAWREQRYWEGVVFGLSRALGASQADIEARLEEARAMADQYDKQGEEIMAQREALNTRRLEAISEREQPR
jgi:hypothetical protein